MIIDTFFTVLSLVIAKAAASGGDIGNSLRIPIGKYCIKAANNAYLRANYDPDSLVLSQDESCDHWHIEERDGKAALKAHNSDLYLCEATHVRRWDRNALKGRRSNESLITLAMGCHDNDKHWTMTYNDDGSWSFANFVGLWLSAQLQNSTLTLQPDRGANEHFLLEWPREPSHSARTNLPYTITPGAFCIVSAYVSFLQAAVSNGEWTVVTSSERKPCEHWDVSTHDSKFSFTQSVQVALRVPGTDKYLRALGDGSVELSEWGVEGVLWTLHEHRDMSGSFRSAQGDWLRVQSDGRVSTSKEHRRGDEQFRIIQIFGATTRIWTTFPPTTTSALPIWTSLPPLLTTSAPPPNASTEASEMTATIAKQTIEPEPDTYSAQLILVVLIIIVLLVSAAIYSQFRIRRSQIKRNSISNELIIQYALVKNDSDQ